MLTERRDQSLIEPIEVSGGSVPTRLELQEAIHALALPTLMALGIASPAQIHPVGAESPTVATTANTAKLEHRSSHENYYVDRAIGYFRDAGEAAGFIVEPVGGNKWVAFRGGVARATMEIDGLALRLSAPIEETDSPTELQISARLMIAILDGRAVGSGTASLAYTRSWQSGQSPRQGAFMTVDTLKFPDDRIVPYGVFSLLPAVSGNLVADAFRLNNGEIKAGKFGGLNVEFRPTGPRRSDMTLAWVGFSRPMDIKITATPPRRNEI